MNLSTIPAFHIHDIEGLMDINNVRSVPWGEREMIIITTHLLVIIHI